MRIQRIDVFEGPNVYCLRPTVRMLLDLGPWDRRETLEVPGFNEALVRLLPGLKEHHCSRGRPGGLIERLREGTWFGHVVEHVALELQARCGVNVRYGRTRRWSGSVFAVVFEHDGPLGGRAAAEAAVQVVLHLLEGRADDAAREVERAAEAVRRERLGPSTAAILSEARRRGIPVRRLGGSLLELGHGVHRKRVWATVTDRSSAVAVDVACDKALTKEVLRAAGVPVPEGVVAEDESAAVRAFFTLGPAVVVKPAGGNQGRGVTVGLTNEAAVRQAFARARRAAGDGPVIVERHVPGHSYRVLVVDGEVVAAARRIPPFVVGDGEATVAELVRRLNADPRRGEGHERSLTRVTLDDVALATLARQGLTPESVPERGSRVWLRDSANLSTGGSAVDVSNELHPEVAAVCRRAARAVGLDVAGVDVVARTLARPLPETGGAVIEVNACPGLRMHLDPDRGEPRAVAKAIVDSLFGDGDGRIPIVAVTGTNGKTTVTRLVAHILEADGRAVGAAYTGGVRIAGEPAAEGDTTGPRSARLVLSDPRVEAAVLETARGGIIRGGLGFDECDVAVITNIGPDHLGQDGLETLEDLVWVKSLLADVTRRDGWLVLNADDPTVASIAGGCNRRVAWFTMGDGRGLPRRPGDAVACVREGWLCVEGAGRGQAILPVADVALARGGALPYQVANALAAAAAAWALGVPAATIAEALRSFADEANPGRFTVRRVGGVTVVVDYGHNAPAWEATLAAARRLTRGQLWGVIGVPGDRRDDLVAASGRVAGRLCDRVVIKEDRDRRGRPAGEVARLLRDGAAAAGLRDDCIEVVADEIEALRAALQRAAEGDTIVVFYEELEPVLALLDAAAEQGVHRPPLAVR